INLIEGGRVSGAVSGIFGNPNDLALNMVTFLPLAIMIAMTPRLSAPRRLIAVGIAACMFATVIFTKSRGGAIGMVAMLLAFVLLNTRKRPGMIAAAACVIALSLPFVPSAYWSRLAATLDEEQDRNYFTGSTEARRIDLQVGIEAFLEEPLTGVG